MNVAEAASIFGVVATSVAALLVVRGVIERLRAERALRRAMRNMRDLPVDELEGLLRELSAHREDRHTLDEAQRLLETHVLVLLKPLEKSFVLEGFRQPSERGRANYAGKVLTTWLEQRSYTQSNQHSGAL